MKRIFYILVFTVALFISGCSTGLKPKSDGVEISNPEKIESQGRVEGLESVEGLEKTDTSDKTNRTDGSDKKDWANEENRTNRLEKIGTIDSAEDKADTTNRTDIGTINFINFLVPFTPQAPYAVWDDLHNEACEEASMIMAHAYFTRTTLNPSKAESEIQKFVQWQAENGYTVDITAQEVAVILREYYSLHAEVSEDTSTENIQTQLQQGKLIIVPAAGRLLGNPYYRRPGPLYHMLVIRGYDANKKEFITNDPGTKRGEGYRYTYQTVLHAIHDWPKPGKGKDDVNEEEMNSGRKVMIVVSL